MGNEPEVLPFATVGELVNRRLSEEDRWNLAMVQRDEVWDEVRMRHLLDSLLVGYPIGALLLCRVRTDSRVTKIGDGERRDEDAAPTEWQLLDGQQRVNALFSMLTDKGNYGRFHLNMTLPRVDPGPVQRRAAKDRSLPHIAHRADGEDDPSPREHFIDLTRWAAWAQQRESSSAPAIDRENVCDLLRHIDPQFTASLSDTEADVACQRLAQLLQAWHRPIPVQHVELETPLDVLEVFTRINLGGVQVGGMDVYFAGVKTFWRDAERRLDRLVEAAPVLRDRFAALRLLSRLASRGLGYGDPLPLVVDQLSGRKGESVRAAMGDLTDEDAAALKRISNFCNWYVSRSHVDDDPERARGSQLGHALRQVARQHWDEVLAWVAASPRSDEEWWAENSEAIDSYLLGVTLFSYRSALRERFARLALLEALDAGARGESFPLSQIAAVARGETQLRGPRGRAVLGLDEEEDRARISRRSGWLLISLAQRIPYEWSDEDDFDWDHIIPKAHAYRMWAPGQGRRRHHKHRHLINTVGNFWALNKSVNRGLGKTSGHAKFDALLKLATDRDRPQVWPVGRWALTDEEIDSFIEVDRLLDWDDADRTDKAMTIFRDTVTSRTRRLLEEALDRFPMVRILAADDSSVSGDSAVSGLRDYTSALGLSVKDPTMMGLAPDEARRAVHRRARGLHEPIRAALAVTGSPRSSWVWHQRGAHQHSCVAFELADRSCIELVLRWNDGTGMSLAVKAYPKNGQPGRLYPDFDHIPLGVGWDASDDDVVEAFLVHVERLQAAHPRQEASA